MMRDKEITYLCEKMTNDLVVHRQGQRGTLLHRSEGCVVVVVIVMLWLWCGVVAMALHCGRGISMTWCHLV